MSASPTTPLPAGFDEGTLVAKAKAGDAQAFTDLVNQYERKIYRLAKNITQNDEDAEDVLQDTFLKAYEHLSGFHGNSKFYTWIVRIAVNEALMKLRKRKGDRFVSLDASFDGGEILTKPLKLKGKNLHLNANSDFGEINVETLDSTGRSIAKSKPIQCDNLDTVIEWEEGAEFKGAVALRITLKNACLYALWSD